MKNYGNPGSVVCTKFIRQLKNRLESVYDWIFYTNPPVQIINNLDINLWKRIQEQEGLSSINNNNVLNNLRWTIIPETDPTNYKNWKPNLVLEVSIYIETEDEISPSSPKKYLYDPRFLMYHQGFTLPQEGYVGFFDAVELYERGLKGTNNVEHPFIIKNEDWIKLVTYLQIQNTYYAWGFGNSQLSSTDAVLDYWARDITESHTLEHDIHTADFLEVAAATEHATDTYLASPINLTFSNSSTEFNDNTFTYNLAFKYLAAGTSIIAINQPTIEINPLKKEKKWSNYLIYTISAASYFVPHLQNQALYFQYLDRVQQQYSDNYIFSFDLLAHRYMVYNEDSLKWTHNQQQWTIPSFYVLSTGELVPNIYAIDANGTAVATWTNNQPLCSEFYSILADDNRSIVEPVFMDSTYSIEIKNVDNHTYYLYNIIKNEKFEPEVDSLDIQSRIY